MRKKVKEPDFCLCCGRKARLFHASIGHIYTMNPKDWIYLCAKCHYLMDSLIDSNGKREIVYKGQF